MSRHVDVHEAPDAVQLASDLAAFVADALRQGLAARGQALLVVSGGSTPLPFFEALSRQELDWPNVWVTLADERWLPPDHPDSNEGLVRAHLLKGPARGARWLPWFNGAPTPAEGLAPLAHALSGLSWPADVVVLGMGGDGHTASLFPHDAAWLGALDGPGRQLCLAIGAPALPNAPVPRASLSPQALLDARCLVLHITGAGKRALLAQALQPGPVAALPVRLALQRGGRCRVFYAP